MRDESVKRVVRRNLNIWRRVAWVRPFSPGIYPHRLIIYCNGIRTLNFVFTKSQVVGKETVTSVLSPAHQLLPGKEKEITRVLISALSGPRHRKSLKLPPGSENYPWKCPKTHTKASSSACAWTPQCSSL